MFINIKDTLEVEIKDEREEDVRGREDEVKVKIEVDKFDNLSETFIGELFSNSNYGGKKRYKNNRKFNAY